MSDFGVENPENSRIAKSAHFFSGNFPKIPENVPKFPLFSPDFSPEKRAVSAHIFASRSSGTPLGDPPPGQICAKSANFRNFRNFRNFGGVFRGLFLCFPRANQGKSEKKVVFFGVFSGKFRQKRGVFSITAHSQGRVPPIYMTRKFTLRLPTRRKFFFFEFHAILSAGNRVRKKRKKKALHKL